MMPVAMLRQCGGNRFERDGAILYWTLGRKTLRSLFRTMQSSFVWFFFIQVRKEKNND